MTREETMKRALLGLLLAAGCATTVPPVRSGAKLPPDSAAECGNLCASIGLSLSAVVVVQNSVGCVCQPKNGGNAAAAGGAAAVTSTIIALQKQLEAAIPQTSPLDDPAVQLQHR
jgi:hypothetical protein